jgi:hypothetical protein
MREGRNFVWEKEGESTGEVERGYEIVPRKGSIGISHLSSIVLSPFPLLYLLSYNMYFYE